MTDAELLGQYAATRDEAAFAAIVQRHVNLVYRAALRQLDGDPRRAEEATQLVFTRVAQKASTLCRHPSPAGWLYTTTHFVVRELGREERRRFAREQEALTMQELTKDELHAAEWERLRPLLDAAMQTLGERDRDALIARFFEGRTFGEIGTRLALSEDAARMRVARGLEKLRGALARRGVTSTSAVIGLLLANEASATVPAGLAASVTGSALVSAVGAGAVMAPVTGLIQFMSTSKIALGTVGLVFVAAVVTCVYEMRGGQQENAALAERREVFALARRTEDAERRARESVRAAAQTPASARTEKTEAPEKEVNGPFGPNPPGSRARGRALMAAYPEIQRLVTEEKRAFFSAMYQALYRELRLTPAQIEAFEQVKISGVSSSFAEFRGIGSVTLDAAPVMSDAEKESRLREILGERGFQRLEEFERAPRDNRVTRLASWLYFTNTPLNASQAAQFLDVLAACNQMGRDQPPTEYWTAVRARSEAFLAASQLVALSGLQAMDEYNFARTQNQRLRTQTAPATAK